LTGGDLGAILNKSYLRLCFLNNMQPKLSPS